MLYAAHKHMALSYSQTVTMATPQASTTEPSPLPLEAHVRELLEFLSAHQWVYDIQVTRMFQLRWWDKIPEGVR